MDESNRCASLFSLGLCQRRLQVIGGKPVSQIQILTRSQIHASSVNETEMKEYNNDEGARYHEIYKGEIGISLKKHFITALRLPLHPLAGEPNQPCDPANESPLSDAALAFVHAGFSSKDSNLLDRFPERINQVTASLLEKVQAQVEPPKAYPFNRDVPMPTKPPCMRPYIPLNFTSLT